MLEQSIIISVLFLIILSLGLTNILTIIAEKIIMLISLKLSSKQQVRKEEWLASLEYIPSQYYKFYYSISLIPLVFIKDPQILLAKTLYSCVDFGEILFSISFNFVESVIKPMSITLNTICGLASLFILLPKLISSTMCFDFNLFLLLIHYLTFISWPILMCIPLSLLRTQSDWSKILTTLDYHYKTLYLFHILSIFISFILISIVVAEHI